MATLNLYLTSIEPDMDQEIYSQSIGGYCSNSVVYPYTTLTSTIGLYDESLVLDLPLSGNWNEWEGEQYISIGNEIILVSPITGGSISVIQRGYNGIKNMHMVGDIVRLPHSNQLFNDVFNDDYKQYRCLAVKNVSHAYDPSDDRYVYDFYVYLKQNSRNTKSSVKIALEIPKHQYVQSSSTSWNSMQIIDSSLIGLYEDNIFQESYLKIISGGGADGQGRIIRSFDSSTGTITMYNSFSSLYNYEDTVYYEIMPAPSQRIKTGTYSPRGNTDYMTSFVDARENAPLMFIEDNNILNISDLMVNDIFYLWIERSLEKGSEEFDTNDIVLNIKYKIRE